MGNITINSNITGGGGGGGNSVSGASNLTTAGAIPYVSAPGTLNQDPTALFWDAANDRLGIGNNSPAAPVDIRFGIANVGGIRIQNTNSGVGYSAIEFMRSNGSYGGGIGWGNDGTTGAWKNSVLLWALSGNPIRFTVDGGGTAAATFAATTGNFLIGTTTDSNFKLDLAASGSAGTARFYDQAATTGVTRVVVRAGAGQSTTNLQEWQSSAGVAQSWVDSSGLLNGSAQSNLFGGNTLQVSGYLSVNTAIVSGGPLASQTWLIEGAAQLKTVFGNGFYVGWSSSAAGSAATLRTNMDAAFYRNAAGVVEVNNGTAGTYRDLILRRSQHSGVTVANLPAAAAGNAGSIQYVTDANATTIGSTVAGGGANKVMVWSDGAAWKIFAS